MASLFENYFNFYFNSLKKHNVMGMEYDSTKEYAFISYGHEKYDRKIVEQIFSKLYENGFNIWLDIANLKKNADSWDEIALPALTAPKCTMLIYFRSEKSVKKGTIFNEIKTFAEIHGTENIVVIDIPEKDNWNMENEISNRNCRKISEYVSSECNAIRYKEDCNNSIITLYNLLASELLERGIVQNFTIQDNIIQVYKGKFNVKLNLDQLSCFNVFIKMLKNAENLEDGQKQILAIEGDPGTGKSTLAMYMLSFFINKYGADNVYYVTRNMNIRHVWVRKVIDELETVGNQKNIAGDFNNIEQGREDLEKMKKDLQTNIFKGQEAFSSIKKLKRKKLIIVDEAQRIENGTFWYNASTTHIIGCTDYYKNIIKKGDIIVFLYDERQKITINEYYQHPGDFDDAAKQQLDSMYELRKKTVVDKAQQSMIEKINNCNENINLKYKTLKSQVRINGMQSYIRWVDALLDSNRIPIKASWIEKEKDNYDLQVFDDPNELYKAIEKKNREEGLSRVIGGYCWNKTVDLDEYNFHMPVSEIYKYDKDKGYMDTYLTDETSIDVMGVVHTVQGLELAYAGVIIGPDMYLKYNRNNKSNSPYEIETQYNKRAENDKSVQYNDELSKLEINPEEYLDEIVRNTYRILLTRGKKGTYIYCCDKALGEYIKEQVEIFNKKTNKEYVI